MGAEHSDDFWAVVFSGGRAYIGQAVPNEQLRTDAFQAHKLAHGTPHTVVMTPCYEVTVHVIPQRGTDGQPVMSKNISAEPVLLDFEDTPTVLAFTGVVYFADMKEQTKARYKRLAEAAEQQAMAARGAETGIVLPKG